jgi:DNA-binding transcriptional LysR family regulator
MKLPYRTPPLNSLKVFMVAAEHSSIAKAAIELNITQGAVSKQVKHVEECLGVALFVRRNRGMHLTNEGTLLCQTCQQMFSLLSDTCEQISEQVDLGPLVISCEPTIAMHWLIPRLAIFKTEYPDIDVHLFASGGSIDLKQSKVDLALRRNDFTWSNEYYSEVITVEKVGPVCTPNYWKEISKELVNGCILHTKTRPEAWTKWKNSSNYSKVPKAEMTFEHFYLSLQAAANGLGVAIGSAYMTEEDINSKRLIAPYGFINDGTEYHLISEQPFEKDDRKETFKNWLKGQFK